MTDPVFRSKRGWNSTKNSPVVSSSASQRASTSWRARGRGVKWLIASHFVWRMSSGATRTLSASGPSLRSSSSRNCSGVRSTSSRRARPYIGARAQFRPNAAETARSASTPSGRTNTARAFRQRSSRPRTWPSRTLPDALTDSIVNADGRIGTFFWASRAVQSSLHVAEATNVLEAVPGDSLLRTLHRQADLFDHVGIRQRRDVADLHLVRYGGKDAAHDLARPRLGHVRDDVHRLRARDLADHRLDRRNDLLDDLLARRVRRLERDVDLGNAALDVVHDRNDCGLRDLRNGQASGLELLGAQPMARHVDHVVDAPENPEVAVGGEHSAVGREVRPVAPVRALRVSAVLGVVLLGEAVRVSPDR